MRRSLEELPAPRIVLGMSHNTGAADRLLPPQAFYKSARAAVGPGAPIVLDPAQGAAVVEGELALVIGRDARRLTPATALDAVVGFTIGNDVTLTGQVPLDDHLVQAKSADGGTPVGPWLETELDWRDLRIETVVDDRVVAAGSTAELAWDIVEVLCYLTEHVTLGAGDIVLTGAPHTTAPVVVGQQVGIRIAGLGELRNPVVEAPAPAMV